MLQKIISKRHYKYSLFSYLNYSHMKKIILFVSLITVFSLSTFAQHSIQTMVFDSKNGLPIEMGAVKLLHLPDSTFIQGCLTDSKGGFMLSKVKPGNYSLIVTMVGYVDYRQKIIMSNKDLILKNIHIQENSHLLNEVEVKGTAAQMVVKGDTLEYNATAFKTNQNAVVEDLLKRLPGVEVSSEGKITVNGEEIKKIRVDGKKFLATMPNGYQKYSGRNDRKGTGVGTKIGHGSAHRI